MFDKIFGGEVQASRAKGWVVYVKGSDSFALVRPFDGINPVYLPFAEIRGCGKAPEIGDQVEYEVKIPGFAVNAEVKPIPPIPARGTIVWTGADAEQALVRLDDGRQGYIKAGEVTEGMLELGASVRCEIRINYSLDVEQIVILAPRLTSQHTSAQRFRGIVHDVHLVEAEDVEDVPEVWGTVSSGAIPGQLEVSESDVVSGELRDGSTVEFGYVTLPLDGGEVYRRVVYAKVVSSDPWVRAP